MHNSDVQRRVPRRRQDRPRTAGRIRIGCDAPPNKDVAISSCIRKALHRTNRFRLKTQDKVVSWVLTIVMCLSTLLSGLAPAAAYASPTTFAATRATSQYQQVDNSVFFNEGYYLNQTGNAQDPPFTINDFTYEGGHVVKTARGVNPADENGYTDEWMNSTCYDTCRIWPDLVGLQPDEGFEGWAFICDDIGAAANGARISMTYKEVGELKNAADDSFGKMVDIKATYTLNECVDASKVDAGYGGPVGYDGHPVLHFCDNFSYGTFQYGVVDMTATFEFYDSNTGQRLDIDNIYYTKTSMDKGETLAIEPSRIYSTPDDPGVYLSSSAHHTKNDPLVGSNSRFDAVQGTYIYANKDVAPGKLDGYYTFSGVPDILNANNKPYSRPPEYVDSIGDPSYYWRSVCVRVDMSDASAVSTHHLALGSASPDWSSSFDIPDTNHYNGYACMYTTHNFLPLTNPKPQQPEKLINDGTDVVKNVGIGDTVNYKVKQQVVDLGHDGLVKYESFKFIDPLPKYVKYVDGSAEITDPYGNPVSGSDYTLDYDQGSNTLTATFSADYLSDRMVYNGGDYTLSIDVEVVDQPEDDLALVENDATVEINGYAQTTNVVEYEPIHPALDIEKHAVLDYKLASAINEYEYLNHDENENFSTVHYEGYMQNVTDKTRAKNVTIYDNLAPGLTLVPGSIKVTGADGIQVTENPDGKGWTATLPDLYPWTQISFEYDCYTTTEGNGLEVINTAKTWCTNATLGTEGAEDKHASDDGEIYINDPNLKIVKNVTESPIQNDDYQRGEEYRVDDTFQYSVTLTNTVPGTFAKNVRLTDDDMPEGFELVGDIQVTGLDNNGVGYKIPYPISGVSDSIHGEEETRTIEYQLTDVKKENGSWGWNLDINYLDYNRPVTVTWTVKATQSMNGYEVYNRARATADNQPNDVFQSTDGRTGADYTIVWINTPEFQVDKSVRKTDSAYQIGDVAAYDVEVTGLKTPGTLARETTLEDEFLQEGTTIIENSFVITDKPTEDQPQDISGQVELNRYVGKQGWHIDMTQVYGDEHGYWVNSEDWRPIFKDGVDGRVDGEHNPVQTKPEYDKEPCVSDEVDYAHDYFKVHYEATINDMALQNEIIHNEATADSLEGYPVTDDAEVTAIGAQLMINKDSNDGGSFAVGDVAQYEITITNNATGTVAEDVQMKDGFTTAKAGTVSIVEGSIKLFDNKNNPIEISPEQITYTRNEAGGIFGFEIDTNYDLPSSQKITVRYDVKYLSNNGGDVVTNVAHTWASNAPEVEDPYETWPEDMDQSDLRIDKGSDKQEYKGGSYGTYTLNIVNHSDETALNVTINDDITLDSVGIAQVVQGSIKIWDHHGDAVSWDRIVYHYANGGQIRGFTIYTDHDLEPNESMQVVYQMRFDEVAQDTTVHNDAWTAADNTGKATDDNDVLVKPDGGSPENPGTDPGTDPKPEPGSPALSIVKDSNKQWFTPGEQGRYTLRVTNTERGTVAENVRVNDALDADSRDLASIVEGSVKVTDATGAAISVESVNYLKDGAGRAYGIQIATGYDLAYGGAVNVSYDVLFDGIITGKVNVHNAAAATSDNTPEAQTDHNVSLDTEGTPELTLDKSVDKTSAARGDTLTYTVTVTQPAKGMTATDVVVTDTLPDGLELDQSSVKVEKNGHEQTVDAEFPAGKLRVSLGDVAYGETWTITYKGKVAEDFLGDKLENTVIAESPDIPETPEDKTETTLGDPALQIEKVADKDVAKLGEDLTWEITVTQTTKGETATDVVVTDQLPDGFTADQSDVTVTDAQGETYRANVTLTDGKLTVELGDLAYNDPVTITVPGKVDSNFDGDSLLNTAVAESTNVPDPVKDDEEVPVTPPLDKKANVTSAKVGDTVTYTISTTAKEDLSDARITDEGLPEGMVIDMDTIKVTVNGTFLVTVPEKDGTGFIIDLGDLKADDEVVISYEATVKDISLVGTSPTNTATLESPDLDKPLTDTEKVPIEGPLTPAKDVQLDKHVSDRNVDPGDTVTYTITVVAGEAKLENAVVTDVPADGVDIDEDTIALKIDGKQVAFNNNAASGNLTASQMQKLASQVAESGILNGGASSVPVKLAEGGTSAKAATPYYTVDSDGTLTIHLGDLNAQSTAEITYDAVVDKRSEHVGDDLKNTATLDADNLDEPLTATAVVSVGTVNPTNTPTPEDVAKDLGKNLGKTGDWLAQNLGVVAVALVAVCVFCLAMYKRDDLLVAAGGMTGPVGTVAGAILHKMAGTSDAAEESEVASGDVESDEDPSEEGEASPADTADEACDDTEPEPDGGEGDGAPSSDEDPSEEGLEDDAQDDPSDVMGADEENEAEEEERVEEASEDRETDQDDSEAGKE